MMKRMMILISSIGLILTVMGCSASRQNIAVSQYNFDFEGQSYVIESKTPHSTEGFNTLLHRDGGTLTLRAIDKEQDGMLDEVIRGDVALEEANRIYAAGIAMGRAKGQVRKRNFTRVYRTSDMMNDYVLKTYILAMGEEYNMLSILRKEAEENPVVVFDNGADGTINKTEKEALDVSVYQDLYDRILKKGLSDGRITRSDGRYYVSL